MSYQSLDNTIFTILYVKDQMHDEYTVL